MAALDAVVLLARESSRPGIGAARAANHDAALFGVDVDLIARQAGQFRGEDELVGGFVQIDRRRPAGRVGADKMPELFVEREQIAQRIPAREGHVSRLARLAGAQTICATIARIYSHSTCHSYKRRDSEKGC